MRDWAPVRSVTVKSEQVFSWNFQTCYLHGEAKPTHEVIELRILLRLPCNKGCTVPEDMVIKDPGLFLGVPMIPMIPTYQM